MPAFVAQGGSAGAYHAVNAGGALSQMWSRVPAHTDMCMDMDTDMDMDMDMDMGILYTACTLAMRHDRAHAGVDRACSKSQLWARLLFCVMRCTAPCVCSAQLTPSRALYAVLRTVAVV